MCDTIITNLDNCLRVAKFVTQTVVHSLVLRLQVLDFKLKKLVLPVVRVNFSHRVPNFGARLMLSIMDTSHIKLAVKVHVNLKVLELLLVRVLEVRKYILCQVKLKVESILCAEEISLTANELLSP